ncbi:MAG: hypothetical protein V4532_00080 [Pseudomonadota bacterium]
MQRFLVSWLSAGALMGALCAPAMAGGTLFRCGSSYQDRPCDASQPSKVISGNGRVRQQAPEAEAAVVDVECAGRGARAKQIVWAKESGKTAEVQMASATSDEDRRMIADVYRRRGSSLDVKNGIEADCMAEKDRAAQGAAMIEAGLKLQGRDKVASAPAVPSDRAQPAPAPQAATVPSPAAAADKAARCQSLKAQVDSITSRQQSGGSMDQMEQLNRQRQTAAKAMRDVGC